MKTKYLEIDFGAGESIESAVRTLNKYKLKGVLVCGTFNGATLYSDVDDLNSAYKKITGKTKDEFDKYLQEEDRRHKEAIPSLTKEWIEKGNEILDKEYHEKWAKCVPIRLGDLYRGMELGACLDIVRELNNGCDLSVAKSIIDEQGHSGMSYGLVCSMVRSFSKRGDEFINFVK